MLHHLHQHPQQQQQYVGGMSAIDDWIVNAIGPFVPQATPLLPLTAAVDLISMRLGLLRTFVQSSAELYCLQRQYQAMHNVAGAPIFCGNASSVTPKFVEASELLPMAKSIYASHLALVAPATGIAPPPRQLPIDPMQGAYEGNDNTAAMHPSFASLPPEVEKKICNQYRMYGVCRFGSRCLYHHSVASATEAVSQQARERAQWAQPPRAPTVGTRSKENGGKRAREAFSDISNDAFSSG